MRVDFLFFGSPAAAQNVRYLSGVLKQDGHETRIFFLPDFTPADLFVDTVDTSFVNILLEIIPSEVQGSDVVCLSSATNTASIGLKLMELIGDSGPFRLVGGSHASVRPASCLESADAVCVGEGEVPLRELVSALEAGEPWQDVPGIFSQSDCGIRGTYANPVQDLDSLGIPDYGPSGHFVYEKGSFVPVDASHLFFGMSSARYMVVNTMRGCPYSCSFCHFSGKHAIPLNRGGSQGLRRRSVNTIIEELKRIRLAYPEVRQIGFFDSVFLFRPLSELREFGQRFKNEIGLGMTCQATPGSVTEEKLRTLLDAGLEHLFVGVQSGSEHTNFKVYDRPMGHLGTSRAIELLNQYATFTQVTYGFIVDNPYEGTEHLLETLRLMKKIKSPSDCVVYPLVFLPGTTMHERAVRDGLLHSGDWSREGVACTTEPRGWNPWPSPSLPRPADLESREALNWLIYSLKGRIRPAMQGFFPSILIGPLAWAAKGPMAPLITLILKVWCRLTGRLHLAKSRMTKKLNLFL